MIPDIISEISSKGEQEIFYLLKDRLTSDYICWYELDVQERYADFIIVGPEIGVLVVEVKDWTTNNIHSFNKTKFYLTAGASTTEHDSPKEQGLKFRKNVWHELFRKKAVISQYKKISFNYIISFPNMTKEEFLGIKNPVTGMAATELINPEIILFKEDIEEIRLSDGKTFIKKLKSMLQYKPKEAEPLAKKTIDDIRDVLYPMILIKDNKCPIMKKLELQQEQIVKRYPFSNILIRGNAGSGKSIVLIKRAQYLSKKFPNSKILLLCYNKSLATHMRNEIFGTEFPNIQVYHYEGWSAKEKYDFIFIDEAQDLKKFWYSSILNALSKNNELSHICIAADGAQLIYEEDRDYSYEDIGIKFEEIELLEENYRNTAEICTFSEIFLLSDESINECRRKSSYVNEYVSSINRKYRSGKIPELEKRSDFQGECRYIESKIKMLVSQGVKYSQIGILIFKNEDFNNLVGYINSIPINVINKNKDDFDLTSDNVHTAVVNSAKGFEFDYVFLCGFYGNKYEAVAREVKRVYVGMTRAIKELYVVYSCDTQITQMLEDAYQITKERCNGKQNEEQLLLLNKVDELQQENAAMKVQVEKVNAGSKVKVNFYINEVSKQMRLNEELMKEKAEVEKQNINFNEKIKILKEELRKYENKIKELLGIIEKQKSEQINLTQENQRLKNLGNVVEQKKRTPILKIASLLILIMVLIYGMNSPASSDILQHIRSNFGLAYTKEERILSFVVRQYDNVTSCYIYFKGDKTDLVANGRELKSNYNDKTEITLLYKDGKPILNMNGTIKQDRKISPIQESIPLESKIIEFEFCNDAIALTHPIGEEGPIDIKQYAKLVGSRYMIGYDLVSKQFIEY
jgi:hypothetical protein